MFNSIFLFCLIIFSFSAFAQQKPQAVIFDETLKENDVRPFAESGFEVVMPKKEVSEVPPVWKRNTLLQESELLTHVKNLDELDLDLLYLDAKDKNTEDLIKKYPNLPVKKLKLFKTLVTK